MLLRNQRVNIGTVKLNRSKTAKNIIDATARKNVHDLMCSKKITSGNAALASTKKNRGFLEESRQKYRGALIVIFPSPYLTF